jgi:hypothetical protein
MYYLYCKKEGGLINMNENKWILYITIPLTVVVLMVCVTLLYLNNHPYPVNIGFTMDNNALEAVKIVNNYTTTTPEHGSVDITYYVNGTKICGVDSLRNIPCTSEPISECRCRVIGMSQHKMLNFTTPMIGEQCSIFFNDLFPMGERVAPYPDDYYKITAECD